MLLPSSDKQTETQILPKVSHITEVGANGAQDTLPPNVALWHSEYFELKEFQKMAQVGRSL